MPAQPIPEEIRILLTTGRLTADQQTDPKMECAVCRERSLDLVLKHRPRSLEDLGKLTSRNLPGLVHGKDVAAVCPCCSYPGCTHRQVGKAA